MPFVWMVIVTFSPWATGEGWKVDFSRRASPQKTPELRQPAALPQAITPEASTESPAPNFMQNLFMVGEPELEVVILQTEKGFVPKTIPIRKGQIYRIHVVNVNESAKNVSFILDSFSEHHATYYGRMKTFVIRPQAEGVYSFVSPETSAQGQLVVLPEGVAHRLPASRN